MDGWLYCHPSLYLSQLLWSPTAPKFLSSFRYLVLLIGSIIPDLISHQGHLFYISQLLIKKLCHQLHWLEMFTHHNISHLFTYFCLHWLQSSTFSNASHQGGETFLMLPMRGPKFLSAPFSCVGKMLTHHNLQLSPLPSSQIIFLGVKCEIWGSNK